ncbi:MAG: AI-2E family transporter, partial [Jaaginema sp. PMC 1079.18]|nr:AI-2E family transporter [Jaaginema sp. PMC 1079.18]MEC4867307.1 AI-2E family transporter [Jaaginema sp. PMC 1078.18]
MTFGKWVGFAVLLMALVVLWNVRQLVLLILTAVFLADALSLLVNRLQRWRIPRSSAVLISFSLLIAGLVGLFWLIVPPFTEQFEQLAVRIIQSLQRLNEWLLEYRANLNLDPEWTAILPNLQDAIAQLQPLINQAIDQGLGFFSNTFNILLNTLLVAVLTLMILANPQPYRQGFIRLFPSFYRRRVDEILVLCDRDLQGWLIGVAANMAAIGTFSFIGLSLLGIPLAFAQAILAALFTLIPNIGPALSVIPPVAIAFLDAPWKPLAVLILYIAVQQLESSLLTPYIMAKQVSLLPAVTLLAQVFFTSLFGVLGLFLALPLTVIGQIWLKEMILKDVLDRWQKPPQN